MIKAIFCLSGVLLMAGCSRAVEQQSEIAASEPEGFTNVVIGGENSQPAPEAISKGRFEIEGTCLLFSVAGGKRYNPIIAGDAEIEQTSTGARIEIGNKQVAIGDQIIVVGGGSGDVRNLSPEQQQCSESVFVIGDIIDDETNPGHK